MNHAEGHSDANAASDEQSAEPTEPNHETPPTRRPTGQAAPPSAPAKSANTPPSDAKVRVFTSAELFVGSREIHIQHGDDTYRLMITRNDKLILQK